MPFGIPNEDFHGGFGILHDEDDGWAVIDVRTKEQKRLDAIEDMDIEDTAQVAYDSLTQELMAADDTIRSLEQDKKCLIHYLKNVVEWLNYFITTNPDDIYIEEARTALWAAECRLMEMEESL